MYQTIKSTPPKNRYPANIPANDLKEICCTLDESCYALYNYYHFNHSRWEWRDEQIIVDLNWSKSKLIRCRRKLIGAGWMDIIRRNGDVFIYLGKGAVQKAAADRISWKLKPRENKS